MFLFHLMMATIAVGLVLGSPLEKRSLSGDWVSDKPSEHKRMQKYLEFFYTAAKLSGLLEGCPVQTGSCEDGWVSFGGSCYLFVDTEKRGWDEAKTNCAEYNAHLAVIETEKENNFLKSFIERLFKNKGEAHFGFWVGATDMAEEGTWRWYTDNSVPQYSDFQPGHIKSATENCLILWGHFDFKWADHYCAAENFHVCEQ